ncbi:hypothetical protein K2X05_13065 [bacterium]|nr:hypothetical protein [bacterium]
MKKAKELMEQLGFNKNASFEAKKAFIKHLIKEAHFQEALRSKKNHLQCHSPTDIDKKDPTEEIGEQLSFFAATGTK